MNKDYAIEPVKTDKDKIKHPKLSEAGVIPKLGSSILLIGVTKSGKSVLLHNLLAKKEFYGGVFDKIFTVSPAGDSTLEDLDIPEEQQFNDLKKAEKALSAIHKHQKEQIKKHGPHKAHQFAIVLDDVIGDHSFMKSPEVLMSFIANRHHNETVFLCSQHLRSVPKVARLQASFVCIFECSSREQDVIAEEYCPAGMTDKQFKVMMAEAWSKPYQFLTIHRLWPLKERYRMGLAQPFDIAYFKSLDLSQSGKKRAREEDEQSRQNQRLHESSTSREREQVGRAVNRGPR
ncbi:MAG: ATPase/DNA packaging protein [Patescibacteria group bacterium]